VKRIALAVLLCVCVCAAAQGPAPAWANPKVRAITGFVRLDQGTWEKQVAAALVVLRKVKSEFEAEGYRWSRCALRRSRLGNWRRGCRRNRRWLFWDGSISFQEGKFRSERGAGDDA